MEETLECGYLFRNTSWISAAVLQWETENDKWDEWDIQALPGKYWTLNIPGILDLDFLPIRNNHFISLHFTPPLGVQDPTTSQPFKSSLIFFLSLQTMMIISIFVSSHVSKLSLQLFHLTQYQSQTYPMPRTTNYGWVTCHTHHHQQHHRSTSHSSHQWFIIILLLLSSS